MVVLKKLHGLRTKPALQVGGVSNETVKYDPSSAGLGPQSDCSGKKQLYK
jgi:hypothetical protein